jgi:hypothetical protein
MANKQRQDHMNLLVYKGKNTSQANLANKENKVSAENMARNFESVAIFNRLTEKEIKQMKADQEIS